MKVADIDALVEEFAEVKKAKEEAEAREKAIKERFMEELSKRGTNTMKTKKHKIVCTEVVSTRVDSKKLKEKFPGVYESCSYASCSNRFNIK
jgi:predicted phage-related endonuclease